MNEAGLRIRVDGALRRDFIETCKANDTTAAQALRAYMRSYVEEHGADVLQGRLFEGKFGQVMDDVLPQGARS